MGSQIIFGDFDTSEFWEDPAFANALKNYVEPPPTPQMISLAEAELGFKLPASYVELMTIQNGGIPKRTAFPVDEPTTWAGNHIEIAGISGIGRSKPYSLCGARGSQFMEDQWQYPAFGIYICHCPSAGHDMVMLDYRGCDAEGEPRVVHVDQEVDYKITHLAPNFELFIRGLVSCELFDIPDPDLKSELQRIWSGQFSKGLTQLIERVSDKADLARPLRALCARLAQKKWSLFSRRQRGVVPGVRPHFFRVFRC